MAAGRRGRGRYWFAGAGALLLGLALPGLLAGCSQDSTPTEERSEVAPPQQVLSGVNLRQSNESGLLWTLEAARGTAYGPGQPLRLENLTVRFYEGSDSVRSVLTSKRGEIEEESQTLVAQDSVVVTTPKGDRLETESLRWNPREERIETDDFFRLTRGRDVLTGVGLKADPGLSRYTVSSRVRAEVRDVDNDQILEALDEDSSAGASHDDSARGR